MAFIPKYKDEEEQDPTRQGLPQTIPGSEAGGAVQTAPTLEKGRAGIQPFTDVNAYLEANKEQGQGLAGQIGENLKGQGQEAQSAIDTATSGYKQNVTAGAYNPDEEEIQAAAINPTDYIKDTDKASKFSSLAKGEYTGPGSFAGTDDYFTAFQKAQKAAGDFSKVDTDEGKRELIRNIEKNPTAGQTSFDKLILSQNPNAVSSIKSDISPFADIENYLSGKVTEAGSFADQAAAERAKDQADINRYFLGETGAIPTFQSTVQSALDAKKAALNDLIASQTSGLEAGELTPEAAADLGLDETQLENLNAYRSLLQGYGLEPTGLNSYYMQNIQPDSLQIQNVLTPEQEAQYKALAQLSGIEADPNYYSNLFSGNAGALDYDTAAEDYKTSLAAEDRALIDKWRGVLGTAHADMTPYTKQETLDALIGYDIDGTGPLTEEQAQFIIDAVSRMGWRSGGGGEDIFFGGGEYGALPGQVTYGPWIEDQIAANENQSLPEVPEGYEDRVKIDPETGRMTDMSGNAVIITENGTVVHPFRPR